MEVQNMQATKTQIRRYYMHRTNGGQQVISFRCFWAGVGVWAAKRNLDLPPADKVLSWFIAA
jgi:hypothetical protein